jgi:DNA-directed RNA polymerase subunit RPC12/RpoP
MPEHFTRNTVSASYWCSKCGKPTMHRVDGVKRGPCLDCLTKPSPKPQTKAYPQIEMFDNNGRRES